MYYIIVSNMTHICLNFIIKVYSKASKPKNSTIQAFVVFPNGNEIVYEDISKSIVAIIWIRL